VIEFGAGEIQKIRRLLPSLRPETYAALDISRDQLLRADSVGTMQSLVSLLQILSRQGNIAPADADPTMKTILAGFDKVKSSRDLFDAGRGGVKALLAAAKTPAGVSAQDRLVDLMLFSDEEGVAKPDPSIYRLAADGSNITDQYDAAGILKSESVVHADGSSDTKNYVGGVLASEIITYASGSAELSETKLSTAGVLASDTAVSDTHPTVLTIYGV